MLGLLVGKRSDKHANAKIAIITTYAICLFGFAAMIGGIMFSGLFSLHDPNDLANIAVFFLYIIGVAIGTKRFSERISILA